MRIRLVLSTPDVTCDAVVDAPPGSDVTALRGAVTAACGTTPDLPWWSGRRPLPGSARLGGPGLRAGDEVSIGRPGEDPPDLGGLHLAVVGGPGAGTVAPLGRGVHVVGRAAGCDLRLRDPEVSRRHAAVTVTGGGVTVRDLDSRNGTIRGDQAVDRDGDDLAAGDVLHLGHSTLALRSGGPPAAAVRATGDGRVLVLRPALEHPVVAARTLTAPTEPSPPTRPRIALVGALLPAAAAVGLAWFLHTWQLLAFAALTPLTILGTGAGDRWNWRASRRRAATRHAAALDDHARRREIALTAERAARTARHPDPASGAALAAAPGAALWDRRPGEPDRWHVRLGVAERPALTRVIAPDGTTASAGTLTGLACCVDLARGPLGLAGPPASTGAVARAVLTHLVLTHPPAALEVVVLLSDSSDRTWDWLRWVPHRVRRVPVGPAQAAVVAELAARVEAVGRRPPTDVGSGMTTVLVADRAGALAETPGLADVLTGGAAAGVLAVCVDRTSAALPGTCTAVAVTAGATHALLALSGSGWDTADGRPDAVGVVVADQVSPDWCAGVARALAPLDDGADDGLPREIRWRDLLDVEGPESVAARWDRAAGATPPLRAVVGVGSGGDAVLDLTADGPHALVAGTTGSGKSALLQTWVTALAVAHPPDDLGLLLVDYKGGAAFGACARLPHTQGLVTDLDPHLTARVLRSLDAEIRRRERAFAAVGAADLAAYRRTAGGGTLPRLVVVVDEFATLGAELPDFLPGLVDVAQRGRSLGIHLVLATQRPGHAVSPAVRANTTLRIALRVTDPAESTDVVGVPDAAGLDPRCPGRAVVRTGHGRETVQAARVGGPAPGTDHPVRVHRVGAWDEPPPTDDTGHGRTDLDDLVELLRRAWARRTADGVAGSPPLWRPALPDVLTVTDLPARLAAPSDGPTADGDRGAADPLRPLIGLRDEPDRQWQGPETLDLAAGGSLLVVGAARSGRTGALRVAADAAAAAGVPTVVVAADPAVLGGRSATVATAGADDPGALARLLDLLGAEYAARRPAPQPARPLLVLVDGLGAVTATLDDLDGGRATERWLAVLRGAGSVGVTVVATGDRAVLAARVVSSADRVLLLRPGDPADAAVLGLGPRDLPSRWPPGRGVRADDRSVVQLLRPGAPVPGPTPAPTLTGLRLRPLPEQVVLPPRSGPETGLRLGVGGDVAGPVAVDLWAAGGGRWVVAGPPRSGRSSALALLGDEAAAAGATVRWWARAHSPLAVIGRDRGWAALRPDDAVLPTGDTGCGVVLLDDADDLADAPLSEAVAAALRSTPADRLAVVVAGRPDELLVSYRGVVAEVRRARRGLLLRPGPGDGDLVGVRTGRAAATSPPGRGLLVADGVTVDGEPVAVAPVTVQVARPPGGDR